MASTMQAGAPGSTRIFVKNIPKYVDEKRLREHFSTQGDVTDVKLQMTKDGKSRCFGFVGFKTMDQTAAAIQHFNRSFMDTCKLEVSPAESFKTIDKTQHRPWSKHSEGSSAHAAAQQRHGKRAQEPTVAAEHDRPERKDPLQQKLDANSRLAEFMDLMKPRSTAKTFANDEVTPATPAHIVRPAMESDTSSSGADDDDGGNDGVMDDDISDLDYLKRRVAQIDGDTKELSCSAANSSDAALGPAGEPHAAFAEDPVTQIRQTGRLFIRNLPFVATDSEVQALCEEHGAVVDALVVRDKASGQSKGFAVVTFVSPVDAVAAFEALDASIFQGRLIHVLPGKRPTVKVEGGASDGDPAQVATSSYKKQLEAKRKASAGDRKAWSTFYMREDTVAEAIAALAGIDKAELLDGDASDSAVRLALGEAQVLSVTKTELEAAGANVEALEAAARASGAAKDTHTVARSATTLIVKNLPYTCTEDALADLFEKFGGTQRLILPSTRALALVQLADKQAARAAFAGLAFKRFQHVPLYLEYAPKDVFTAAPAQQQPAPAATRAVCTIGAQEANADEASAESATLFVKNLSFSTSAATLRSFCEKAAAAAGGKLQTVRIVMGQKPNGKAVPKGFAFAEFDGHGTARSVVNAAQGAVLDGHPLELQLSSKKGAPSTKPAKVKAADNESESKLLVRNLAFEASAKDVRALMEAYGHVKSCRLPKKFEGTKRGFAFVEFGSKGEAKKAMLALHGTHLYGRRLLLEYAKEEEGLGELRIKVAAQAQRGVVKKRRLGA